MFFKILYLFSIFQVDADPLGFQNDDIKEISNSTFKMESRVRRKAGPRPNPVHTSGCNIEDVINRLKWRQRMTDDGDLDALRALTILQVSVLVNTMCKTIKKLELVCRALYPSSRSIAYAAWIKSTF